MVGERVRKYRLDRGLTQESLAAKARLHPNYVSLLERGGANISVDSIEKLCKVLQIKPTSLFEN